MLLIFFSNLVVFKSLSPNHSMHNLYTKFFKILEVCKPFSNKFVNEKGNIPCARIIGKISAQTVSQYVNCVNGRPVGRIRCTLN